MTDREQFEAWWKTTGRALCGCSLVPDHTSPNQVFAARGFGAGFAAGFEAARAQPAQAGQVLTDERLNEIFRESFKLIDSRMTPQQLQFARAIEQAVLAKRVPMTDAQINDAYGHARVQHDHIPHDDVVRIVRAAERHHGIGEKA